MRLYLSSYRFGVSARLLCDLLRAGDRVAIISNALDIFPDDVRRKYEANVYDPKVEFAHLGLKASDLDLRRYFGRSGALRAELLSFDLVWVMGGNAFLLRRAMRQSGFDGVIGDLLNAGKLAYGGFSAGAVVATPSLRAMDLMDDPNDIVAAYDPDIVWDGLGLIDFSIAPHYRSNHSETEAAEKAVSFLADAGIPFVALGDEQTILVRDGDITLLPEGRKLVGKL